MIKSEGIDPYLGFGLFEGSHFMIHQAIAVVNNVDVLGIRQQLLLAPRDLVA
jgi:hypothetical protein